MTKLDLWLEVGKLCASIRASGGRAYVVGGAARDIWLSNVRGEVGAPDTIKDVDIEVFGLSIGKLEALLSKDWSIDLVGKAFGVIKLRGFPIDVSVPRRESLVGVLHTDFKIDVDESMTVTQAALRRDFTINALSYDILTDTWEDPCGGKADLTSGTLRPISSAFAEDPLRVLRGMQFIARFGLTPTSGCIEMCKALSQADLPRERIWEEWKKLILRGTYITKAMDFLRDTGWMERFYPELFALIGSEQNPEWHPEGDCALHTWLVVEAFTRGTFENDEEKLVLGLAAFCHDLGKPATAAFVSTPKNPTPHWTNKGHEHVTAPTESFLARLTNETKLVADVLSIVRNHMLPMTFYHDGAALSSFRRLACNVDMRRLAKMSEFDQGGRGPTKPPNREALDWFKAKAEEAKVLYSKPIPLVKGQDLIDNFGMAPGKPMGHLLKVLMEKQLAGEFESQAGGLAIAKTIIEQINEQT